MKRSHFYKNTNEHEPGLQARRSQNNFMLTTSKQFNSNCFLSKSTISLLLFLLLTIVSCKKVIEPNIPTLYISGKVTDKETNAPIDSCKIYVIQEGIMIWWGYYSVDTYYTDHNGWFDIKFSPDYYEGGISKIQAEKSGYESAGDYIDKKKEHQSFYFELTPIN
jgi:hypothetical protein